MGSNRMIWALLGTCWLVQACGSQTDEDRKSSPPSQEPPPPPPVELASTAPDHVTAALRTVLETTDDERPGASAASLRAFLQEHGGYDTDRVVRGHIQHFEGLSSGRYHDARDLAREGRYDEAEAILTDLAHHIPETTGGQKAADHLKFNFDMGKAQHYMVRQRFTEAGEVARELLKRDLTVQQAQQVEQILDSVGQVTAAMAMVEKHNAKSEVRQIMVALVTSFVEEGRYPASLSVEWLEDYHYYSGSNRSIAQIEDYRATRDNYSFTAVTHSNVRIRVENGQILD